MVTVNQYIFQPANHSPVFTQSTNHNLLPALLWLVHSNFERSHWSTSKREHPATPRRTSCFHSHWSIKNRFRFPFPFNQSPSNRNHRCQVNRSKQTYLTIPIHPSPRATPGPTSPPPAAPDDRSRRGSWWRCRPVAAVAPTPSPTNRDARLRQPRCLYDDPLTLRRPHHPTGRKF